MLIFRYLLKETLKSQVAVFLVLMAIFITQKFVRVLAEASAGEIPASLVIGFLTLSTPILASLILPLSLFLGIMLAHGRLYVDSEMAVMRACGISEWYVTRVMLFLATVMAVFTAILTLWLAPLSVEQEYQLEEKAGAESGLSALIAGRFQQTANQNAVIFVHDIGTGEERLQKVFLAQHKKQDNDSLHLVYAHAGTVKQADDGTQQLVLREGNQYEGERGQRDYQVVEFDEYQIQIGEQQGEQKRRKMTAYPTTELLEDDSLDAWAELQWRLAIPLSLPFLVLIAVPLSSVDPRQGRFGKMFPALMLYLGYFMLLMAGRKVLEDGKVPPALGLWWVHGVILVIGVALIVKGRPLGVRLRAAIGGKE
ncbi:LPS export ABC transporter permease LptF [Aestuariibacter sp. AA17]|uniref:Lipopolysaccharide export system permease protein LptF n=1 Tax=Fluctibacter corallii TaxID=2984329 RepID=A0ABT3A706_9ALTE|nr:LPS export ABC transporter permease LptF [Aestuariibacter sp. AA17]MCV2884472.1 LPS export ABC transporter permease LptF [Aestuariibacter sp. AA17]